MVVGRSRGPDWRLTVSSLGGLALGIAVGAWVHAHPTPALATTIGVVSAVGRLWMNALRMTVIPLVVAQLIVAVVAARGGAIGRLGALSLITFVLLLVGAAVFAITAAPPLVALLAPAPGSLASLAPAAGAPSHSAGLSLSDWVASLVPTNPLRAATQDDLLPVLLFTIAFGLALTRVHSEGRQIVVSACAAIAEAMLTLVGWFLRAAPFGVFAIGLTLATETGLRTAHVLFGFVAVLSILLVVFTLLLYPIAVVFGRVSLRRFAASLIPAQIVAVSTRSSLASLPALLEAAHRRLGVPPAVGGVVLPLAVSTFKVNRTISSPTKLLFMAYLYGFHLSPAQLATFVLGVLVLSFSTAGIPSNGSTQTYPLYLAAGVPLEGILIFEAVDGVADVFKTVLNVTGNMTAAAIVARFSPGLSAEAADSHAPAGHVAAAV